MKIVEIKTDEQFEKEVINSDKAVLIDFNADWCGPCQMLKPVLEGLEDEHIVASVNTDTLDNLARSYGVMSIPCMVLIENGEEKKRMIGLHSADEIKEFLK